MKKVSEALKNYQRENHYTYQKTADSLHMSKSTIYAYIHNKRNPSMNSIRKIAKSLNTSPFYLIDDTKENELEQKFLKELRKNKKVYNFFLQNFQKIILKIEQNLLEK